MGCKGGNGEESLPLKLMIRLVSRTRVMLTIVIAPNNHISRDNQSKVGARCFQKAGGKFYGELHFVNLLILLTDFADNATAVG